MDILSQRPAAIPKGDHWPQKPAVRGQTYGVGDPMHAGHNLVVMSHDTWIDFGTVHEALRRKVEQQDKTLIALQASKEALLAQLTHTTERLNNLRSSEKKRRFGLLNFLPSKQDSEK